MANFPYRLDKKLIVVPAFVAGPRGKFDADLILDTGATFTIFDPIFLDRLGFSEADQCAPSTVTSPLGREKGFRLRLHAIECLGKQLEHFEVACHDLGLEHIDGLLGMNFLEQFDFCIFPKKCTISIS